ncbi:MAG TPA: ATP/GTP-binding protein [Streptosporangiaceae bacterium]
MSPRRARRLPGDVPRKGRGGIVPAGRGDGDADTERPVGPERTEPWPDGDWVVRLVSGSASGKSYRCPGCDQEIRAGTAHVVAWPALTPGLDERRHWHRACWQRRLHRKPGPRRPR